MSLSVGIDEVHLVKNVKLKNVDMINRDFFKACMCIVLKSVYCFLNNPAIGLLLCL